MDNLRKKASEAVRALRSRSFLVTLLAMTVSVAVLWIAFGADAVYIRDNGQLRLVYTTRSDARDILAERGIVTMAYDEVDFTGLTAGGVPEIEVTRAFDVKITTDDGTLELKTTGGTVGEILDGHGIDYDEKASLHAGAEFPKYMGEAKAGGAVEIDVIKKNIEEEETAESDEEEGDAGEREMNFVADRINGLMYGKDRLEVYDAGLGDYRPLRFSDIVIIMRKKTKGADFVDILRRKGIPASADVGTGFLETPEIMTILSFLRIIDNPRQDIPLASALRSMAYGLTADELLTIKLESGLEEFWECVNFYAENGRNSRIRGIWPSTRI